MEKEKRDLHEDNNEEVESNLEATQEELKVDLEKGSELEKKHEELKKEFDSLKDRNLRLQADFTNYKRRIEKEKESLYKFATEDLIKEFLTIIDNFERAFASVEEKDMDNSFYQGIEMVFNQFLNTLKKNGLEEIEALGQEFDHNLHHAVMQEESDQSEENAVIEVFQKGYKLKDKVIRPSMVKVSK